VLCPQGDCGELTVKDSCRYLDVAGSAQTVDWFLFVVDD
jgi:hypothetical protein